MSFRTAGSGEGVVFRGIRKMMILTQIAKLCFRRLAVLDSSERLTKKQVFPVEKSEPLQSIAVKFRDEKIDP